MISQVRMLKKVLPYHIFEPVHGIFEEHYPRMVFYQNYFIDLIKL
jgi:hypothetical protein